jgi:hypothetical protein
MTSFVQAAPLVLDLIAGAQDWPMALPPKILQLEALEK